MSFYIYTETYTQWGFEQVKEDARSTRNNKNKINLKFKSKSYFEM